MNQISTISEENNFFIDSFVDLLLTQKLTNIKVLKLKSDQFHDSVIICTANSLVQMSAIIKNIRKNLKIKKFRGCSSAGRAPAWHAGGQGFKSPQLHLIR